MKETDGIYECEFCGKTGDKKQPISVHEAHCRKKTETQEMYDKLHPQDDEIEKLEKETAGPTREEIEELRRSRTPFGEPSQHWKARDDDGYKYRVVNDNWMSKPNNMHDRISQGYRAVEGEGVQIVGTNKDGSPITGVLMRIPSELYEEDQRRKQEPVDKIDEAINRGSLEEGSGDNRYIPQGIRIHSNTRENP